MPQIAYKHAALLALTLALGVHFGKAQAATPSSCLAPTKASNETLARRWVDEILFTAGDGVDVDKDLLPDKSIHHTGFGRPLIKSGDGYKHFKSENFLDGSFTDGSTKTNEIVSGGNRVVVSWTINATYQQGQGGTAPAGTPVAWTGMTIMRVECGKLVETWTEADSLARLQQIGAVSSPTP